MRDQALLIIRQWHQQGRTQAEIARKLETSESQISRWLRGKQQMSKLWARVITQTEREIK